MVLVRRPPSDDPVAQERAALVDQRAALEALKRQLAERVAAVKEREDELRAAIARVAAGKESAVALPPLADASSDRHAARALSLAERERAVAAREAALAERSAAAARDVALAEQSAPAARHEPSSNGDLSAERAELEERSLMLDKRLAELDAREREVEERERVPPDPDEARLAEIEMRLDELRAAEEAFLRTRRELAERSDAVDARERLAAQRERELDERDDGMGGGPDMHEVEARLRRLESQRTASDQTRGFSGGFRKLEQEGSRRPQGR